MFTERSGAGAIVVTTRGNLARARAARKQAAGADVILFSELFIVGYSPEDLVLKPALQAEFNAEPHVRGVCSMARTSYPHSANSQFFICFDDAPWLNGQYTVWGMVTEGMEHIDAVKKEAARIASSAPVIPLAGLKLLSPVANPGKIIAAPVNYQKHLDEVQTDPALHNNNTAHTITIHKAGLFLKANSSLVGPSEGVAITLPDRRTDHEVELAFVIGKTCKNVKKEDAMQYIAGYSIGLDITIRGSEDRSFRKSPDGYTVLMATNGTHGINASLFPKLPFDTVRDFAPITRLGVAPFLLLAHPSLPVTSVPQLIKLARARPGEMTCATPGVGAPVQLHLVKKCVGRDRK